jgi:5-methylcytosine-specific restriction endonuclease McrA
MPVDRTYIALRRAMWESHKCLCCYGYHPLEFGDLQIDHVIPEAVIDDAVEWARTVAALNLPADFDPQGLENLVAACGPCNRRKRGTPFEPVRALLVLDVAARLKARIEKRVGELERAAKETEIDVLIELRRIFDAQGTTKTDREP